jgi:hypothetical protein
MPSGCDRAWAWPSNDTDKVAMVSHHANDLPRRSPIVRAASPMAERAATVGFASAGSTGSTPSSALAAGRRNSKK